MHKLPTKKEADPILSAISRDYLAKRSAILSKIDDPKLTPEAREIAESAASWYLHQARTVSIIFGGLTK